jgi:hypothetical protein
MLRGGEVAQVEHPAQTVGVHVRLGVDRHLHATV